MGRKSNTAERRRQIIGALLHEMGASGYERASTKSIAERAGLAPGLVHYHFKSKQDILLALVDELIEQAEQQVQAHVDAGASAATQLAQYVTARLGLGDTSQPGQVKAWVSIIAEAMGQPRVRTKVAKWAGRDRERLVELLRQAKARDPGQTAAAMLAMMLGSFSLHVLSLPDMPRGYAEPQLQQWLAAQLGRKA